MSKASLGQSECESRVGYPLPVLEINTAGRRCGPYKEVQEYSDEDLLDAEIMLDQMSYRGFRDKAEDFGWARIYKAVMVAGAVIKAERRRRNPDEVIY